jgi:predicted secreted Zn-dependent protease
MSAHTDFGTLLRYASSCLQPMRTFALTRTMKNCFSLTLVVALCVGAASAHAEVSQNLSWRTYDVYQRDGESLLAAIKAVSPVRQNGKIFHGNTNWHVKWNYRWRERERGGCAVTSVSVTADGVITLPKLVEATEHAERQFKPYIKALTEHELGHFRIGLEAARAIERGLKSLPPQADCRTLQSRGDATARQILGEYKERNSEYDRQTQHGRTQGAVLPRDR